MRPARTGGWKMQPVYSSNLQGPTERLILALHPTHRHTLLFPRLLRLLLPPSHLSILSSVMSGSASSQHPCIASAMSALLLLSPPPQYRHPLSLNPLHGLSSPHPCCCWLATGRMGLCRGGRCGALGRCAAHPMTLPTFCFTSAPHAVPLAKHPPCPPLGQKQCIINFTSQVCCGVHARHR